MTGIHCYAVTAEKGTVSGSFLVEPPAITALGFDWRISGDDNRNAQVEVSYRRKGEAHWHKALPLLRLQHEKIGDPIGPGYAKPPVSDGTAYVNPFHYIVPNMFSGSILNLQPDAEYERRFTLSDPDGVKGKNSIMTLAGTRQEPQPASGGQVYHVYPYGYKGKLSRSLGLMNVRYSTSLQADEQCCVRRN